jgi:hypothetical protein
MARVTCDAPDISGDQEILSPGKTTENSDKVNK